MTHSHTFRLEKVSTCTTVGVLHVDAQAALEYQTIALYLHKAEQILALQPLKSSPICERLPPPSHSFV